METTMDLSALALTPLEIALRMLCAMLIGVVIGTEREFTHRPAGMRLPARPCSTSTASTEPLRIPPGSAPR